MASISSDSDNGHVGTGLRNVGICLITMLYALLLPSKSKFYPPRLELLRVHGILRPSAELQDSL
ncbi:hypothetical protein BDW60DRAFT_174153, partial [Aspergillus nidulans var. acristatus]